MSDIPTLAARLQQRRRLRGCREPEAAPGPPEKKNVTLVDVWHGFRKMVFGRLVLFYLFLLMVLWLLMGLVRWLP